MAEDPQPMTLQQRIASLNASHIARQPGEVYLPSSRPRPYIPDRRPPVRQQSFNLPNETVISTATQSITANLPSGPPPLPGRKPPPPLPARKLAVTQAEQTAVPAATSREHETPRATATRTKSAENNNDAVRARAPAWGDCDLPPLPAKAELTTRKKSFTDRPRPTTRTSSVSSMTSVTTNGSISSRPAIPPPPLPTRKSSSETPQITVTRNVPPMPTTDALEKARKASFAASSLKIDTLAQLPPLPTRRPSIVPSEQVKKVPDLQIANENPPPIPTSSRPDVTLIQSTKPMSSAREPAAGPLPLTCMVCRDFSGPDSHAARYPRQRVSSLQNLAHALTAPFPSHTDKARAIFTWLHHNIDYNVQAFFSGKLKSSTPKSTLETGLAVCEGYAALFTNIATYAGLESRVIVGHGKGFGYSPLVTGAPLPPYEAGHAWNAVKIDGGEWKLIDACWGAGHVQGANMPYVRKFAPEKFTQSNERFGIDHFPEDKTAFYLPGGRTMSWSDYIQINPKMWPYPFEQPTIFDNATSDYSIGKQTVAPPNRKITLSRSDTVRFSFGLFCPHWTLENHTRKGLPPVFIVAAGGVDGRNKHYIPLEHIQGGPNGGDMWYTDVAARDLGAPGESLTLFAVTSFSDRKDARGLTVQEFKNGVGRTAMGFVGIAAWDLV